MQKIKPENNQMRKNFSHLFIITTIFLSGCVPTYKSVESDPKAKINFESPSLKSYFLGDIDLDLFIFENIDKCNVANFDAKGKVSLNPGDGPASVYIPANQQAFFRVNYFANFGSSITMWWDISFYVKENSEYTILFKDNGMSIKKSSVHAFKKDENDNLIPINLYSFPNCKK